MRRWAGEVVALGLVALGSVAAADRFTSGSVLVWVGVTGAIVLYGVTTAILARRPRPLTRRFPAYAATVSIVVSALFTVALAYRVQGGLEPLAASVPDALVSVLIVGAMAGILWRTVMAVRVVGPLVAAHPRAAWFGSPSTLSLPWIVVILAVLWAPAVILLAPGSTTYDGTRQLNEVIGASIPDLGFTYVPSNHHPWFATLWQGALLSAGLGLSGGDVNAGLLVHSVVLLATSLVTYAVVVSRIQALTNRGWMLLALAFFGVIPHFANYAMLYEKTGWYQLALIWFFLGVADVALRRGRPFGQAAQLIVGGALASLFRSNGLYIVVPTLVVLVALLLARHDRVRLVVAGVSAGAVLVAVFGWSSVVLPRWDVVPASPGEALVLPFQQVARIVIEHGHELTPDQVATIDAVMPVDQIAAAYNPENGDGVKGLYEIDSFLITDVGIRKMQERGDWWNDPTVASDRNAFLVEWVKLVLRYPDTALSATLNNSYLYFAPPLNRGNDVSLFTGGLPSYFILANEYTDDYRHTAGEPANAALSSYYGAWASTPGVNMLVNPGLYGWIVIALGISLFFWPRRERVMVFAPIVLIYAINFAGARNGDFRYTVPLVALLPICLAVWFAVGRKSETTPGENGTGRHRAQDSNR